MKQDQIQQAFSSCPACSHRPDPALFDASELLQLQLEGDAGECQQWQDQNRVLYLSPVLPVLPCKQIQLLTIQWAL